jgi:hypothetical protein
MFNSSGAHKSRGRMKAEEVSRYRDVPRISILKLSGEKWRRRPFADPLIGLKLQSSDYQPVILPPPREPNTSTPSPETKKKKAKKSNRKERKKEGEAEGGQA